MRQRDSVNGPLGKHNRERRGVPRLRGNYHAANGPAATIHGGATTSKRSTESDRDGRDISDGGWGVHGAVYLLSRHNGRLSTIVW